MSFSPDAVAAALHAARLKGGGLAPLPAEVAPRSVADGAAAQLALARLVGAASPGGFKIGATAKRMQDYLGLSGPAAGFMEAANLHKSGARLRFADFLRPGVECELAVRLAHDLPPGPCTAERAAAAVGDLVAAIEIVENRYGDLAVLGTPTLIADQVYHGAAVLGESAKDGWRTLNAKTLPGRIIVNGENRGEGVGADLLGDPMNSLAWLAASSVAEAFGGLKAGQIVMLGSVTPPIWLSGPSEIVVEFPPLPPVRVTLA